MICNKCDPQGKKKIPERFTHEFKLFLPLQGWVEKTGTLATQLVEAKICITCIRDALNQLTGKGPD